MTYSIEQLAVSQLIKKFAEWYRTQSLINLFITVGFWSLFIT